MGGVSVLPGFPEGGRTLSEGYRGPIGHVIAWPGFARSSRGIEGIIRECVRGTQGILFEIVRANWSVGAQLRFDENSELDSLRALGSALRVVSVCKFVPEEGGWAVPLVRLRCQCEWSDGVIERIPTDALMPVV
jgi:hypothetical protein